MYYETDWFADAVKKNMDLLPYPFSELIEEIGYEAICFLSRNFGGTLLYIPKPRALFKQVMDQQILSEFWGGNYGELAAKYGLCTKTIRNIVHHKPVP